MPGTATEIIPERVRREICPNKLTVNQWTEVIVAAHREGIPTQQSEGFIVKTDCYASLFLSKSFCCNKMLYSKV